MTDTTWTAPILEELSIPGGTETGGDDSGPDTGGDDSGVS